MGHQEKIAATPALSLIDTISTRGQPIRDRFETIRFIRSYIDLYHDIEDYAREYCPHLKAEFEGTITPAERVFLDSQIAIIDRNIISKSGKINQEKCRQEIERITDLFVADLHIGGINTIPKTKESALVLSASIDNKKDIQSLIDTIKADGVMGFYVESINNDIGQILYKRGIELCNLVIGEWDAGSGFSGKSIKPLPVPLQFGPAVNNIAKKHINLPNTAINMFGLFNVTVDNTNDILTTSYGPRIFTINPRQKLSVNRLLSTTNDELIRGSDDTSVEKIKTKPIEINDKSDIIDRAALISLKTWTDLIQIESMSKLMNTQNYIKRNGGRNTENPLKVLTVIYDGLCETTARMYGIGHVLKCQGKIVRYYNYNINSRELSEGQVKNRLQHTLFIYNNKQLLKDYLKLWFQQRIESLAAINANTYDPILFFVSKLFISKYSTALVKATTLIDSVVIKDITSADIKLMPESLDTYIESISSSASLLAELLEMVSKFNETFRKYDELGARAKKGEFLDAYDAIQRLIVATFGETVPQPIAGGAKTKHRQKRQKRQFNRRTVKRGYMDGLRRQPYKIAITNRAGPGSRISLSGRTFGHRPSGRRMSVYTPGEKYATMKRIRNEAAAEKAKAKIELRTMIACTFAYMILRKPRNDRYISKLHFIKQDILKPNPAEAAEPYKINSIRNINIVHNVPAGVKPNPLKAVKNLPEDNINRQVLQNIADIEIAIHTLNIQGYISCITTPIIRPITECTFKNVLERVYVVINRKITNGTYFGGGLSKTRKQKRSNNL